MRYVRCVSVYICIIVHLFVCTSRTIVVCEMEMYAWDYICVFACIYVCMYISIARYPIGGRSLIKNFGHVRDMVDC